MPTVAQLRGYIKDKQDKTCPPYSKLKKAQLIDLASKYGFTETPVKPKIKKKTQKQLREEDVARIVERVNTTKNMVAHQKKMKNITAEKLSARKEVNKKIAIKRKDLRDFQKLHPKIIKLAVKQFNQGIDQSIEAIKRNTTMLKETKEKLKTTQQKFSLKAKNPVKRQEILRELEESIEYYTSSIRFFKDRLKKNAKKITEAQMRAKPWKEIMKHVADPSSGLAMGFMGIPPGGNSSNPRIQMMFPDGLKFPYIDGVNITPYYHMSDARVKQVLNTKY